jgi:hypothetical protein
MSNIASMVNEILSFIRGGAQEMEIGKVERRPLLFHIGMCGVFRPQ